jgi:uncharacterized protein YgbK (DUF1537 family)
MSSGLLLPVYILVLADDMTGALEAGAKFSACGIEALVSAVPIPLQQDKAVVFDTETRHLSTSAAAREVTRFVRLCGPAAPLFIFKKTDSTLRGNIAAELEALSVLFPAWSIGFAPAYPILGRTVQAGVLYVHGIPVAQTEFARDILNPVTSSHVASLFSTNHRCTIFDGSCDAHLHEAARAILNNPAMRIAAGSAALAEAIARIVAVPRTNTPELPLIRKCLVLNGSRHSLASIQMEHADADGWTTVVPTPNAEMDAKSFARENAQHAIAEVQMQQPDAVMVIGGDTAFAVVESLGFPPMASLREIVPGVPVTRISAEALAAVLPGRKRDLYFITKAGGFGDPDVLAQVRSELNHVQ